MANQPNTYSDVSSIAQAMQVAAYLAVRATAQMPKFVTTFTDLNGANPRKSYAYNKTSAQSIAETDDLISKSFTPALDQTLTPGEIGEQFFVTDIRRDSDLPEDIIADGAQELGLAGSDKIETDLAGDMASLTGGTIGAAGTAITWGYLAAAIAQARSANKNPMVPLTAVLHGYQWAVLAKGASIAGASLAPAYDMVNQINASGYVAQFMGVPIYTVYVAPNASDDFTGGVFPKTAIAFDVRRALRIEAQRDASRRGTEYNMSAFYAHGVWRPALGVQMTFDASAPTS